MKELQNISKDEVVDISETPVEKKVVALGSIELHPGQHVWELDLNTGIISKAKYSESTVMFEEKGNVFLPNTRKIITQDQHYYTCAINKRNAKRKFSKMLGL